MLSAVAVKWNLCVTRLMDEGLNFAEATLWADIALQDGREYVARVVRHYLDHGFNGAEALWWWTYDFPVESAIECANAGWHPAVADRLYYVIATRTTILGWDHGPVLDQPTPHEWTHTGLPAHRCLLYLAAGCSPAEAVNLEGRRHAGADMDAGLRTLAALRASDDHGS